MPSKPKLQGSSDKQDVIKELESWIQAVNQNPSFTFSHPERIAYKDLRAILIALKQNVIICLHPHDASSRRSQIRSSGNT